MILKVRVVMIHMLICVSLILSGCNNAQNGSKANGSTDLKMLVNRGDLTPEQIARELELKPLRTYEDFVDLGTAYLWMGNYIKAAEAYEIAARLSRDTSHLAGALYNKAIALGYAGSMHEALQTADLLAQLQPENVEVAWLQYAFYRYSGDNLGLMVSADHLIALDPSLTGHAVLEPGTVALIIVAMVVVASSATTITAIALTPPQDRVEVVPKIMESYARVVTPIAPTTLSFGRYLIELIPGAAK